MQSRSRHQRQPQTGRGGLEVPCARRPQRTDSAGAVGIGAARLGSTGRRRRVWGATLALAPTTCAEMGVMPDFDLRDLDGAPVRLSDLEGRPAVLNSWATSCPPCRRELPALDAT